MGQLREKASANHRSLSNEVVAALEHTLNVPTASREVVSCR
ncbi:Arc family DNA-binding protein [Variibacter gotjawalensis]